MPLALLIDVVVAWLLIKFVPPGNKRLLLGLFGGWLAAIAGSLLVGVAFGWPVFDMLSGLTIGLLVHPLLVAGFVWLLTKFLGGGKGPTDAA